MYVLKKCAGARPCAIIVDVCMWAYVHACGHACVWPCVNAPAWGGAPFRGKRFPTRKSAPREIAVVVVGVVVVVVVVVSVAVAVVVVVDSPLVARPSELVRRLKKGGPSPAEAHSRELPALRGNWSTGFLDYILP